MYLSSKSELRPPLTVTSNSAKLLPTTYNRVKYVDMSFGFERNANQRKTTTSELWSAQKLSSYNKAEKGEWNNWAIINFGQMRDQNKVKWVNMKIFLISFLTPSLPQPVKFPGWQMPTYACKQRIWWSYHNSTFNTVRSDRNPIMCSCEGEKGPQ